MTQKQKVLSAIYEMNINILRELLPDDRTYMDVDKELFLSSLAEAFLKFRMEGDKRVLLSLGKCRTNCCSAEFCGGYKLEGNYSGNFLNLIFLGTEQDITDILVCNDFEGPDCDSSKIDFAWEYEEDQKTEYQPTGDCIIMKGRVGSAMKAVSASTGFLTLTALESWYQSCENLATDLMQEGAKYSFQSDFISVYNKATLVMGIWKNREYLYAIQQEFVQLDMSNELEVLRFLVKNEKFFKPVPLCFEREVKQDDWNRSYYSLSDHLGLRVDINPFRGIIEFRRAYESLYSVKYGFYMRSNQVYKTWSFEETKQLSLEQVLSTEGVFLEEFSLPFFEGVVKGSVDGEVLNTAVTPATEKLIKRAMEICQVSFWVYESQDSGILTLSLEKKFRDEVIVVDYSQIPYNEPNVSQAVIVSLYSNASDNNLLERYSFNSPLARQADWLPEAIINMLMGTEWKVRFYIGVEEDSEDLPF